MRYAVYYAAPADDPLMDLGGTWLGRDPFSGRDLTQPAVAGLEAEVVQSLTTDPRRYGFHGTLKAPFSLKAEASEADLVEACEKFAAQLAPFALKELSVNRLGKFLALTPTVPEAELAAFAGLCVRAFESLRAPLSEADVERRRKSGLSAKQDGYLTGWGYPYIFDEFRFHMTLSNKLEDETQAALLKDAAEAFFAPVTGAPRQIATFGLFTETERGAPFTIKKIFHLTGDALPTAASALEEIQ
jgi:putative phosphonate metabolism protein